MVENLSACVAEPQRLDLLGDRGCKKGSNGSDASKFTFRNAPLRASVSEILVQLARILEASVEKTGVVFARPETASVSRHSGAASPRTTLFITFSDVNATGDGSPGDEECNGVVLGPRLRFLPKFCEPSTSTSWQSNTGALAYG